MRVFVTGASGQLGHDVMNELHKRGLEGIGSGIAPQYSGIQDGSPVTAMHYVPMDVTDSAAVENTLWKFQPDAVIHCAAWTAVDLAEMPENIRKVREINVTGTEIVARACKTLGCKLVYISTDYVFDGQGIEPWTPDAEHIQSLNVYGQSKLDGEAAVRREVDRYFIVRISWAFGIGGKNFVRAMLDLGKKQPSVRVVNDQIGSPTYTHDLARLLVDMIHTDKFGCYHATNEGGYISWADFTREIFRQAGYQTEVIPVTSEEYGLSKAKRPQNSRMDTSKLIASGFELLPDWQDALRRYLEETKRYEGKR